MINILSIKPSTLTLSVREQVMTVSLFWYDGVYLASTNDFGVAFRDFRGRGSNAIEAVSDLFDGISVAFGEWADEIGEQTLED
jgi:hypothetical protein